VPLFLRGLVIGFSIAAPVGPIGVLCIRRTLADGRAAGFFSGLGAATADALYGAVAAFGLTAISSVLIGQATWLRLGGGLFLCYLGIKTFLARPAAEATPARATGLIGAYVSTLLLTLANPTTILSFVGGRGPRPGSLPGLGPLVAPPERRRRLGRRAPGPHRARLDQPRVGPRDRRLRRAGAPEPLRYLTAPHGRQDIPRGWHGG
jgi:LysE type translocator